MRRSKQFLRATFLVVILSACLVQQSVRAQPLLEQALANLYAKCLFEDLGESNPFSDAAALARQSFAPGISGFIESNLSSIPLTPPSLEAEFTDAGIVSVVTGFTPIYTESSATVGKGLFLVGANASHFDLSKIRGEDLNALQFSFRQNGGGDVITANMPMNISATVFTFHATYGITDRFDIGFALPVVNLTIDDVNTTFSVEGNDSGCRYGGPNGLNCDGEGNRDVSPLLLQEAPDASERETFIETLAIRAKYRFPASVSTVRLAAVMDIRMPLRSSGSMLGSGNFGTRFTFISEYNQSNTFQPYINFGGQFWNGPSSNSLNVATGFSQQLASSLFFSFDLLGNIDLEDDPFLAPIGGALSPDNDSSGGLLEMTTIPALSHDHSLNAGLGFQIALSQSIHAYGSALFSLLDQGLQSDIVPTAGIAAHF